MVPFESDYRMKIKYARKIKQIIVNKVLIIKKLKNGFIWFFYSNFYI